MVGKEGGSTAVLSMAMATEDLSNTSKVSFLSKFFFGFTFPSSNFFESRVYMKFVCVFRVFICENLVSSLVSSFFVLVSFSALVAKSSF